MPPAEIYRSAEYWKNFHARRARQRARTDAASVYPPLLDNGIDLHPQQPIVTFIPGRLEPVYSRLAPNGTLIPLPANTPAQPSSTRLPRAPPTTATHPAAPSKVVARFKKRQKHTVRKDSDEELLLRLQQSRIMQEQEAELRAAAAALRR
ncbi:hypothetical protein C8R43DRAFT_1116774 [Mycena crocata]|nr:hypothetical protein C8R43DRAFT_1116774 [Mycena crocata]